jgi:hypothetical protein
MLAPTHFQPALPSAWLTARNLLKPLEPLEAFRITQAKETMHLGSHIWKPGEPDAISPTCLDSIRNKVHCTGLLWNKSPRKVWRSVEIRNQVVLDEPG